MKSLTVQDVNDIYSAISLSRPNSNGQKFKDLQYILNSKETEPAVRARACFYIARSITQYANYTDSKPEVHLFGERVAEFHSISEAVKFYLIWGRDNYQDPSCTAELANLLLKEKLSAVEISKQFKILEDFAKVASNIAIYHLVNQCTYIESIASLWRLSCDPQVDSKTTSLIKSSIAKKRQALENQNKNKLQAKWFDPRTLAWISFLDDLIKAQEPSTSGIESKENKPSSVSFNTQIYHFILSFNSFSQNAKAESFWYGVKNYAQLEENQAFKLARTELFKQLLKSPQPLAPLTTIPTENEVKEKLAAQTYTALIEKDAKLCLQLGKLWQQCDPKIALGYYQQGAGYNNNQDCQANVAIAYYQGLGVTQDKVEGLRNLMALAKAGNDIAQAYLLDRAIGATTSIDLTIRQQLVNWESTDVNSTDEGINSLETDVRQPGINPEHLTPPLSPVLSNLGSSLTTNQVEGQPSAPSPISQSFTSPSVIPVQSSSLLSTPSVSSDTQRFFTQQTQVGEQKKTEKENEKNTDLEPGSETDKILQLSTASTPIPEIFTQPKSKVNPTVTKTNNPGTPSTLVPQ